jgi:hypothetical protein
MYALLWDDLGSPGMEPERLCQPGMGGGLLAAAFVSPVHHLRTIFP